MNEIIKEIIRLNGLEIFNAVSVIFVRIFIKRLIVKLVLLKVLLNCFNKLLFNCKLLVKMFVSIWLIVEKIVVIFFKFIVKNCLKIVIICWKVGWICCSNFINLLNVVEIVFWMVLVKLLILFLNVLLVL